MLNRLASVLGITFQDETLLKIAMTHRSFWKEHPERTEGLPTNERVEFLGDAVLNFLTASWLYEHFPERSEGELSTLRSVLVKTSTLARFARELDLGTYARISRSEEARAGRSRDALLADLFEAVVGVVYLDQGIERVRDFVLPFLERETQRVLAGNMEVDYRTRLQQLLQAKHGTIPTYRTVNVAGPDHCRHFTVEVLKGEEYLGSGTGSSKQSASQEAARIALERMLDEG